MYWGLENEKRRTATSEKIPSFEYFLAWVLNIAPRYYSILVDKPNFIVWSDYTRIMKWQRMYQVCVRCQGWQNDPKSLRDFSQLSQDLNLTPSKLILSQSHLATRGVKSCRMPVLQGSQVLLAVLLNCTYSWQCPSGQGSLMSLCFCLYVTAILL